MDALTLIFIVLAGVCLLALLFGLYLRRKEASKAPAKPRRAAESPQEPPGEPESIFPALPMDRGY